MYNVATGNGYTALIFAASEGQLKMVESLIAKGADVKAKTVVGTTAALLASMEGHKDVVEALVGPGTPPIHSSSSGTSASRPVGEEAAKRETVTTTLLNALTFLSQEKPVEAAECLLDLETAGDDEPVSGLKKAAAVALANYPVNVSNKYLGMVNEEISRNRWDSGYNLAEAQGRARNLKFKTITWLKMASALDPSNGQISELIESYFQIHVNSLYDKESL